MFLGLTCSPPLKPPNLYSDARDKLHQGFLDTALQEADQGYQISAGKDFLWEWKFRILEAEVYLRENKPAKSLEVLGDQPLSDLPPDIASSWWIAEGEGLCRVHRVDEALVAFHQVDSLMPSGRKDLQSQLELARGRCAAIDNRARAKDHYVEAARLAHGEDSYVEGIALLNLGFALSQEDKYDEAIEHLKQVQGVTTSLYTREKAYGNLGFIYSQLGDWKTAISFSQQASNMAEQIKFQGDQEKWLVDLGRAHFALAEFTEAEPDYRKALEIARREKDTDAVSRCLNDLIQLALRRHDVSTANQYWQEEAALTLGAARKVYVSFDAAGIAVERRDFPRAELLFKELLATRPDDALRLTTERELGNVYWHEGKIAEADRTFREAINDAEGVVAHLPPQYQMSFLDEDPFYDSYVRFLVAQGKTRQALAIAERGRGQILSQATRDTRGSRPSFDLAILQSFLKRRNQVALAYSLTDEESFLWVITPSQFQLFRLPGHKTVAQQIDAYKAEMVDHPRAVVDSPAGQELYKTLIQPAEKLIKSSRVVVISSKILSLVSFEALIVPGDRPHYWIEDVEVETASSLALLTHFLPGTPASARNKKELLLFGAPVAADNSFPVLKHAAEEIDRVRSHFPAHETSIQGKDAVPAAYRASNPGDYRLIHIDAHSVASDLSPLDSYVVLSPAADGYKLFAHEIENTRLHADLVTISACYSAGSRWYQGEGIVGLGWAFLREGAHQVVASLWAVDEASTPQLMDDFYRELSQGKPASQALHDAKLNMLHSGGQTSRPYYWASLQLYTGS